MKGLQIILLAIAIVFLAPAFASAQVISTPEPWDYRNGILDLPFLFSLPDNDAVDTRAFDNDLSTKYALSHIKRSIDFSVPVNLRGMYLNVEDYAENGYIEIIFENGKSNVISFDGHKNGYFNLSYDNVIKVSIVNGGSQVIYLKEVEFFGNYELQDTTPPADVTGLKATEGNGKVILAYTLPPDDDFSHVNIYQDGVLIADSVTDGSFTVDGLTNGRKYEFKITSVDIFGNESNGVSITATPAIPEVKNLRAEAKHDRVNLSWEVPKIDFHHVNIYRKTLEQSSSSFFGFGVAHAAEGYDPIFETNGTYFNDLTVEPETSYEYLLTTEDLEGTESPGVTVQVTTPPIPPPSTGGTTIIRHENGDVTVRWTPQPGQMLIEIDGVEYRRVDAQLGEYTIPAADIPVDEHGKPAPIRLIPIAPNGDMGTPIVINPGGWLIALPFGVKELLEAGIDLLAVFGPIILLVLVLWYVRPIMRLLRQSARGRART